MSHRHRAQLEKEGAGGERRERGVHEAFDADSFFIYKGVISIAVTAVGKDQE